MIFSCLVLVFIRERKRWENSWGNNRVKFPSLSPPKTAENKKFPPSAVQLFPSHWFDLSLAIIAQPMIDPSTFGSNQLFASKQNVDGLMYIYTYIVNTKYTCVDYMLDKMLNRAHMNRQNLLCIGCLKIHFLYFFMETKHKKIFELFCLSLSFFSAFSFLAKSNIQT